MFSSLRRAPWLALAALLAATPVRAQQWSDADLAAAAALRDRALAGSNAFGHVSSLTTEVGPRLAGSPGDAAAVRWALAKLGALGFTRVRSQDVLVPRWVRGEAEAALLGPVQQSLAAVALGGSVGTGEDGVEAPIIEATSLEALSAMPPKAVAGRIVFLNQRMERTRDASGYGRAVRGRVDGPSIAGALGAAAFVIRSVGTSNERFAHTGTLRYAPDAPRMPAFSISNPDADLLERQLKLNKNVRLRVRSTARELPSTWSANVIGEIPGRGKPEEIVVLGAHLDSWDITPGALDDASGVAIVMEAARLIAKMERPPQRTIRVVLFANEEAGGDGAREYVKQVGDELARHVIAMEADLGQGPVWRVQSLVAPEHTADIDVIRKVLEPLKLEPGSNTARGGADLTPMRDLGVPVLELSHDATSYFDVHHTVNDTLLKVDAKILDQSVAAYAVAAYLAATKQGDFGRLPVSTQHEQTSRAAH